MKTSGDRKSKAVLAPEKHNASAVCSGIRKSRNRSIGQHQKVTGGGGNFCNKENQDVLPFRDAQVLDKQIPDNVMSYNKSCEISPMPELKTGQLHPSTKIKLQLFPVNEGTRLGLEVDGHNPFLELTLRARKKISSVLKHLNCKWGSSSVAQGEITLFPYNIQLDKIATYKRWTLNDGGISAGDVYAAIGSPIIFRLRYGWSDSLDLKTLCLPSTTRSVEARLEAEGSKRACCRNMQTNCDRDKMNDSTSSELKPVAINKAADVVLTEQKSVDVSVDCTGDQVKVDSGLAKSTFSWDDNLTNLSIGGLLSEVSLQGKFKYFEQESNGNKSNMKPIQLFSEVSMGALLSEASMQEKIDNRDAKATPSLDKEYAPSSLFWDDSLTTLSIGGLLSEASLFGRISNCDPKSNGSKSELRPTLLISDSFDAFIAGQPDTHSQASKPSSHVSHSSILDAEETCHAFPSRKFFGQK